MPLPRVPLVCLIVLSARAGEPVPLPTAERAAWEQSAIYSFNESHAAFAQFAAPTRTQRLGDAMTLLNVQPRTDANVFDAYARLEKIAAENPDDESGILARYFLGRVAQIHLPKPDLPAALKQYRALFDSHPEHPLAQRAGVKWVVLYVYLGRSVAERAQRFSEAETLAPRFTEPAVAADFHLLLADVSARTGLPAARELAHLRAALDGAGPPRRGDLPALVMRTANTARAAGQPTLAAELFRRYVREFPRENRSFMAREALAQLEAVP